MKHLKLFESLNIENICGEYNITNYEIVDGLVNVDGDVGLTNIHDQKHFKIPVKFGEVTGNFDKLQQVYPK